MSEQYEQQPGEEERLLEAIAVQRELIDAVAVDDEYERAPHQRKLGRLELKYQLLLEKERLSSVLAKFQAIHGTVHSEPCLLCLDSIHIYASANLVQTFDCCGGFICTNCSEDLLRKSGQSRCPLCRSPLVEKATKERVMKLAKRGTPWAQTNVGYLLNHGIGGFQKDEEGGLEWTNKAAAQNHPSGVFSLSKLYLKGLSSVLRKSQEKANELLLKSANLGFSPANAELARNYFYGENGFEKDSTEAYFRASVAFVLDEKDLQSPYFIGTLHYAESGMPEPSPYLACYYLNIAANGDNDGWACFFYCQALRELSEYLHDGNISIPGSNIMPAVFFWMRKSRDLGDSRALEQLNEWESVGQSRCDNCQKEAKAGGKFKQCSKCKAQWYCSRECQVEAWKAGHKKDCKRAGMLNFEEYLNAD